MGKNRKRLSPEKVGASAGEALPANLLQQLQLGLRSSAPDRQRAALDACGAAHAFAAGFASGADPERARRRHVLGANHEHWLAGYQAGQRAADDTTSAYLRTLLAPPDRRPRVEHSTDAPRPSQQLSMF